MSHSAATPLRRLGLIASTTPSDTRWRPEHASAPLRAQKELTNRTEGSIATGATPLGAGRLTQSIEQTIGFGSVLIAAILAIQRLLVYIRNRVGTDQYGGVLSWLTGN